MTDQKALGPRLFSVEEADELLPRVRKHLARFQDSLSRYEELKRDTSVLRLVSASGGDQKNPDAAALGDMEDTLARLVEEMQQDSVSLEEGIVKSGSRHIEQGVGVRAQSGEHASKRLTTTRTNKGPCSTRRSAWSPRTSGSASRTVRVAGTGVSRVFGACSIGCRR